MIIKLSINKSFWGKIKIIACLIKFAYLRCLQRAFILLQIRTACYGCYDEIITVLSTPGGGHSQPETEESRKSCNFAPKENSLNSAALSPNFRRVRRCNWTRFLSLEADNLNIRANLKCTKNPQNGQVVYETLENIPPNTDLVVSLAKFFDSSSYCHNSMAEPASRTEQQSSSNVIIRAIAAYMQGKIKEMTTIL